MNCLAIDDEPLALNVIKDFCKKINYLNLVATCTGAADAIKYLSQENIDLIFLDIHMPHITGLEFIKSLSNPPLVIFTTAYTEHALQGFESNAIDYLVKPVPFERFLKAVNKAYELINLRKKNPVNISQKKDNIMSGYLMVKVAYSTIKINFSDILYIEGLKDYIKIYTGSRPVLTKSTMINIEEKLPAEHFIRVHKSYIVSISKINKIENNRIIFGEKRIPVGNNYKINFNNIIKKYLL
jgi:two-component system LytT family response regulator